MLKVTFRIKFDEGNFNRKIRLVHNKIMNFFRILSTNLITKKMFQVFAFSNNIPEHLLQNIPHFF